MPARFSACPIFPSLISGSQNGRKILKKMEWVVQLSSCECANFHKIIRVNRWIIWEKLEVIPGDSIGREPSTSGHFPHQKSTKIKIKHKSIDNQNETPAKTNDKPSPPLPEEIGVGGSAALAAAPATIINTRWKQVNGGVNPATPVCDNQISRAQEKTNKVETQDAINCSNKQALTRLICINTQTAGRAGAVSLRQYNIDSNIHEKWIMMMSAEEPVVAMASDGGRWKWPVAVTARQRHRPTAPPLRPPLFRIPSHVNPVINCHRLATCC